MDVVSAFEAGLVGEHKTAKTFEDRLRKPQALHNIRNLNNEIKAMGHESQLQHQLGRMLVDIYVPSL